MPTTKELLRTELAKPPYQQALSAQDWVSLVKLLTQANLRIPRGEVPGWKLLADFTTERVEARLAQDPQLLALLETLEVELAAAGSVFDADGDDVARIMGQLQGAGVMRDRDGLPLSEQTVLITTTQYIPTIAEITSAVFNDDGTRAI